MRRVLVLLSVLIPLTACSVPSDRQFGSPTEIRANDRIQAPRPNVPSGDPTLAGFSVLANAMGPVIEAECEERTNNVNCDFAIIVHPNRNLPANAFQTERNGQPLIIFTQGLIRDARNMDELAFVIAHEAAHHIAGHLTQTQANAAAGAIIAGGVTAIAGQGAEAVQQAQRVGLEIGARRYSRDFELEADALGTIITWQAGFDPLLGAEFFNRIPDPGDVFLGTHPPNAQRIAIVRQTVAQLR